MAEVAEGAAMLVPPGSVTDLADALEGALRSDSVDERRRRGIEVARRVHLGGKRRPSPRGVCHGDGGPEVGFRGCGR